MKKSVYSIVLNDSVVERIDMLAKLQGTNRSALINRILADSVRIETPEKVHNAIYEMMSDLLSSTAFSVLSGQPENSMAVSSVVNYKYNPTVRYQVELLKTSKPYSECDGVIGKLRIQLRTRNLPLLERLDVFFRLWAAFEDKYIGDIINTPIKYEKSEARFSRELLRPIQKQGTIALQEQGITMDNVAEAIAEYIKGFDRVMKHWFDSSSDYRYAAVTAEKEYADFIKSSNYII